MQHVARYLAGLGLALSFGFAHAQTPGSYGLHERSIERINGAKDLGVLSADTLFGEQVSLFNGSTTFENVDISIPGNSGLPVELRRKLNVDDRSRLNGQHLLGFGEWDVARARARARRIQVRASNALDCYGNCSAPNARRDAFGRRFRSSSAVFGMVKRPQRLAVGARLAIRDQCACV